MSTYSTVLNGQLIPVAPVNGVYPLPAPAPLISQGSAPSTLPGAVAGAALNTTMTAPVQAGGSTSMGGGISVPAPPPAAGQPQTTQTVAGLQGNLFSGPFWNNTIVLVLVFLVIGYVILRRVHWQGG